MKTRKLGRWVLGALLALAVLGPSFAGDPTAFVGRPLAPPSWEHWLGTTGLGQDVLAQLVAGARVTLGVGFATGALVVAVGAVVGAVAGYAGGRWDAALSLLTNVFLVLPGLPLLVVLAAWLPPGPGSMVVALSVAGWAWTARVVRAAAASLASREFIDAARVAGEPAWRIVAVELLPNLAPVLRSSFIGATTYAIGAQVGLGFLGLGDLSGVSWGTSLYQAANDAALLVGAWWTFVPTGLCVAAAGFGLAAVEEG